MDEAKCFTFPVIVKPADSAGSKGVSKAIKPDSLKNSIHNALSHSIKKEFIIEEFIAQKGWASDTDSFSYNGELIFTSFNDQWFDPKAENPFTPSGYNWPSSMEHNVQVKLTSEIQRLIRLLNMETAIYNIETRIGTDNKAYIMELSPRGGGNRLSECLRYATNVDLISNMVKYSVGMSIDQIGERKYDGYWAEIIIHSDQSGIFRGLWISEEIRSIIVDFDLWVRSGMKVREFSGANETLGTMIISSNTPDLILKLREQPQRYIKVLLKE